MEVRLRSYTDILTYSHSVLLFIVMTVLLVEAVLAPFINLDNDPHPRDLLTLRQRMSELGKTLTHSICII